MFRFTIRALVLVTVVVALAVGWWLAYRSQQARVDALEMEVRHLRQVPWYRDSDGWIVPAAVQ